VRNLKIVLSFESSVASKRTSLPHDAIDSGVDFPTDLLSTPMSLVYRTVTSLIERK
jgi:hypothetical protein